MPLVYHSSPSQVVQFGVESTAGTAVTADQRFGALKMGYWSPQGTNVPIVPSGYLFSTSSMHTKEWSQAPISGMMSYNDLPMLFNSILKSGGTPWAISPVGGEAFSTFTIDAGDANQATGAYRYTYCYADDVTLTFDRDKCEVGGQMQGQAETAGVTLATGTLLAPVPVQPQHVGLWTSATYSGTYARIAGAGMTAQVKVSNRRNQVWTLDDSFASFTAITDKAPSASIELSVVADTASSDYYNAPLTLAHWRAGDVVFLRIKATPSGHNLQLTMAATIEKLTKKDMQGILALDVTLSIASDASNNVIGVACS
jgi:hypothetical protein